MEKLNNLKGKVLVALALLTLVIIGLIACKPNVNQFITEESFRSAEKDCEGTNDAFCSLRPSLRKVEEYCLNNKLSFDECSQIANDVAKTSIRYREKNIESMRNITETIKRVTEETKRQNGLK